MADIQALNLPLVDGTTPLNREFFLLIQNKMNEVIEKVNSGEEPFDPTEHPTDERALQYWATLPHPTWLDTNNVLHTGVVNDYPVRGTDDLTVIKEIYGIGTERTTLNSFCYGASNLVSVYAKYWAVENLGVEFLFRDCVSLANIYGMDSGEWLTKKFGSIRYMFYNCDSLENLDFIANWDVSAVTNASYLFNGSAVLKSVDLRTWNASSFTSTASMFIGANELESLIGGATETVGIKCLEGWKNGIQITSGDVDRPSIIALFRGLADLSGQTTLNVTLTTSVKARLSDEDKAIATNKNWTIV